MTEQERIALIVIYIIIFTIEAIFLLAKKKEKGHYCYKGIVFAFLFLYDVIPLIILWNIGIFKEEATQTNMQYLYEKDFWSYMYSILITILGLISFHIAYSFFEKKRNRMTLYEIEKERKVKLLKIITWLTFSIGAISLLVFCQSFGGITTALKYAEVMRGFSSTYKINYWASILIIPARLVTVSPFLFIMLNSKEKINKKKIMYAIFCVISFLLSIVYFLVNAGKAPILMFGLCFIYAILKLFTKKTWTIIIILGMLSIPLLGVLDSTFLYLANGKFEMKDVSYYKYITQFTYPVRNTLNVADIVNKYGYRYGTDYITGTLNIFPKVNFKASYEDTSEFYGGQDWKKKGGVPNDFITFSYLQLGVCGVIILSALIGVLLEAIDARTILLKKNFSDYLLCGALMVYSYSIILNADPEPVIKGNMIYFLLIFVIIYTMRREKGKRKKI